MSFPSVSPRSFTSPQTPPRPATHSTDPLTPTPHLPAKYHHEEQLDIPLNRETRRLYEKAFRKQPNSPIAVLPKGGMDLVSKLKPLLPEIGRVVKKASSEETPSSPIHNLGSLEIRAHVTDASLKEQRAFSVKTFSGDSVLFGQHVQTDPKGIKHNSLYPIEGILNGNPIIQTTAGVAQSALQAYKDSPLKQTSVAKRIRLIEDQKTLPFPEFLRQKDNLS